MTSDSDSLTEMVAQLGLGNTAFVVLAFGAMGYASAALIGLVPIPDGGGGDLLIFEIGKAVYVAIFLRMLFNLPGIKSESAEAGGE
jgi:hypothetical protein